MQPHPFDKLNHEGGMTEEYRKIVVSYVLQQPKQERGEAQRQLTDGIRNVVKIKGYRDPLIAPPQLQHDAVVRESQRNPALLAIIVRAWAETHEELCASVRHHLHAAISNARSEDQTLEDDAITAVVAAVAHERPKDSLDDVKLMIFHLSVSEPVPAAPDAVPPTSDAHASSANDDEPVSESWEPVLAILRTLPADRHEWDAINTLITEIEALAHEKLAERLRARQSLRDALTELAAIPVEQLQYVDAAHVRAWSADRCVVEQAAELAQEVRSLRELLMSLDDLRRLSHASYENEKEYRPQIDLTVEQIRQHITRLDAVLGDSDSTPPDDSGSAPPEADPDDTVDTPQESAATLPISQSSTIISGNGADEEQASAATETADAESTEPMATACHESIAPQSDADRSPLTNDELRAASADETAGDDVTLKPVSRDIEPVDIPQPIPTQPQTVEASPDATIRDEGQAPLEVRSAPRPAVEIARVLQAEDTPDHWNQFVWSLVAEDDIPAAWWVTRWLEERGQPTDAPAWLLAALWGGRWVEVDSDHFVTDLQQITSQYTIDSNNDIQQLLGLAAGLCPALTVHSGVDAWLDAPGLYPALHEMARDIQAFTRHGLILRPVVVLGAANADEREETIIAVSREANEWLRDWRDRRVNYSPATDVWRVLAGRGAVHDLLAPVTMDDRELVDRVSATLDAWRQPSAIDALIDMTHRKVTGKVTTAPILIGPARQRLRSRIEEAASIARRWAQEVERERQVSQHGIHWITGQTQHLRTALTQRLPSVEAELSDMARASTSLARVAAVRQLTLAVQRLRHRLGQSDTPDVDDAWPALVSGADTLGTALFRRLLWIPDVAHRLTSEQDATTALPTVAAALRDACVEPRLLEDALREWVQHQDYRYGDVLLAALDKSSAINDLTLLYDEGLAGSRSTVRVRMNDLTNHIEQAAIDGAISDDERIRLTTEAEQLHHDDPLTFAPTHARIDDMLHDIEAAYVSRLAHVRKQWAELQPLLAHHLTDPDHHARFSARVEGAIHDNNIRVADEYLAQARHVIDGHPLDDALLKQRTSRPTLEEFGRASREMQQSLRTTAHKNVTRQVANSIKQGGAWAGLDYNAFPARRAKEATDALDAWERLKQAGRRTSPETSQRIGVLLTFLGFSLDSTSVAPVTQVTSGQNWIHLRARISASDLARPIPQFGSQAHGVFDVVGLWDRPGADMISASLGTLGLTSHPVVAIYFGRLQPNQRKSLAIAVRGRNLTLAILDELLLLFLTQERDARLPAFLRCALPFASVNPYEPSGPVPPEMFYGRTALAQSLQQPLGTNIIYGGRQLGKSALLKRVERDFSRPELEQYASIIDLKGELNPLQEPDRAIWRLIRDRFIEHGIISVKNKSDLPDKMIDAIREAMRRISNRRVIIMFDEADEFLDAEARSGFRIVVKLRDLMMQTDRRFRVVFAGLHGVQRFDNIPNHPFVQFGAAASIGPLEPDAAFQLVREPFEVLGYRFKDPDVILRILAYTNYHPGLIQLFCKRLLEDQASGNVHATVPINITAEDVDSVYRNPEVQKGIRDRFAWTLTLDKRYQAVAWSMISEQSQMGGYGKSYASSDLLFLVRDWWSRGFDGLTTQEFRVLLDEMCGLNVLMRSGDGAYRLRSANVVRLMGSQRDVEEDLLELAGQPPPRSLDAGSYHDPLSAGEHFSPLSGLQTRSLHPPHSGIAIICASPAQGLAHVSTALLQIAPEHARDDVRRWAISLAHERNPEQITNWFNEYLIQHQQLYLYCQPTASSPEGLRALVDTAYRFIQREHRRSERVFRLTVILDPAATWTWLCLPEADRDALEELAGGVIYPRTWNAAGVRQRLAAAHMMDSDDRVDAILTATGGWPLLLDRLFDHCGKDDDSDLAVSWLNTELRDVESSIRNESAAQFGLTPGSPSSRILAYLLSLDGKSVPRSFVAPAEIPGQPVFSTDDCSRALSFLERMGCVRARGEELEIDPIVSMVLRPI